MFRKDIRISHLILFAGGIVLVSKGLRFMSEFVLLSIPLLHVKTPFSNQERRAAPITYCRLIVIIVLIVMPFLQLKSLFLNQPRYPVAGSRLPHGITSFLKHVKTNGLIFNDPNTGGYLQWELFPEYKIYMDMEVPFLFTDEDIFVAINAVTQQACMKKVIDKYHPEYISVSIGKPFFQSLLVFA